MKVFLLDCLYPATSAILPAYGAQPFGGGILAHLARSLRRHLFYSFELSSLAILAGTIGPFAAIAVIPKLDWWQTVAELKIGEPLPGSKNGEPEFYTSALNRQLWPMELNESNLPSEVCLSLAATTPDSICPVGGYPQFLEIIRNFLDIEIVSGDQNWTIPEANGTGNPRSIVCQVPYSRMKPGSPTGRVATSLSQLLTRDLVGIYDFFGNLLESNIWGTPLLNLADLNGSRPLKPVVQVQCLQNDSNFTELEFPHSLLNTPPFVHSNKTTEAEGNLYQNYYLNGFPNVYVNESWMVSVHTMWNITLLEERMEAGQISFTWVDVGQHPRRPSVAAAMAITSLYPFDSSSQPASIITCSIDARWLPTDLWITPSLSDSYYESTSSPLALLDYLSSSSETLEAAAIDIDLSWANALNIPTTNSSSITIETLLSSSGLATDQSGLGNNYFSTVLALVVTDGLARTGLNYNTYGQVAPSEDENTTVLTDVSMANKEFGSYLPSPVGRWTRWNIKYYHYGYGYGLTNITSKIAAGVLSLYGLIAIIAMCSILLQNRSSNSWSSLGELLALAINSPPSQVFRNTGAGMGRINTWKEMVRVRVTDQQQLQMIFESHEDFDKHYDRRPKDGEKYE